MSKRSTTIIRLGALSKEQACAVATLGTGKATETARRDAAKTLHSLLLATDPRASAEEMMHTAARLAASMKAKDPKISNGTAYAAMRAHLVRTGDFKPHHGKKHTSASPSPAPNTAPRHDRVASSEPKKAKPFFGGLLGR